MSGGGPKAAEKARILLKLMQFIGAVSGGKTVTQVALNYLMCKGVSGLLHHLAWHCLCGLCVCMNTFDMNQTGRVDTVKL